MHFWHQHVFFGVYAGWVNLKSQTYIFATFERYDFFEAGRPPECSFLLIFEIEISQVITNFHHHIKT